jgi:hypothetical protein
VRRTAFNAKHQPLEIWLPAVKPLASFETDLDDEDVLALIRQLGRQASRRGLLAAALLELEAGQGRDGMRIEGANLIEWRFRDGEGSRNWGRFETGARDALDVLADLRRAFGADEERQEDQRRGGRGGAASREMDP